MLAQLLIQFQMPLEKTAVQNVTTTPLANEPFNNYLNNSTNSLANPLNETFDNYLNNSTTDLERMKRNLPSITAENEVPRDSENSAVKNSIPQDSASDGKRKKTHQNLIRFVNNFLFKYFLWSTALQIKVWKMAVTT